MAEDRGPPGTRIFETRKGRGAQARDARRRGRKLRSLQAESRVNLELYDWNSMMFTLFLETVEPVAVESEGSGIFSFVWQQLIFPAEARWCFSWAQDCGLDGSFPGSAHSEPFGKAAAGQGSVAGKESDKAISGKNDQGREKKKHEKETEHNY
ncbi:putative uncharacterized protein C10orf126 [Hylobates moloch]|uniref:putative uncharacterized protein C10orf126 n=1 Tax=Hylobates moloch TaxID=81572 RepID=UPI0026745E92|nr:putative uncharacterized protein C10orf126 [Hylobates moloch]